MTSICGGTEEFAVFVSSGGLSLCFIDLTLMMPLCVCVLTICNFFALRRLRAVPSVGVASGVSKLLIVRLVTLLVMTLVVIIGFAVRTIGSVGSMAAAIGDVFLGLALVRTVGERARVCARFRADNARRIRARRARLCSADRFARRRHV